MVCPTCGLDNDPAALACARCNTTLAAAPAPPSYQPQPAYQRPPRNAMPLIAGLLVVVLIALVVGFVLNRGRSDSPVADPVPGDPTATTGPTFEPTAEPTAEPTPEPTTPAADPLPQVQVVDALLDRSGGSRKKLNDAIAQVGRCSDVPGALADLRAVGDERRAQIAELRAADLTAVPGGDSMRSTLLTALQHSLDADEAFVAWAEPAVSSCRNTTARRADYARGLAASDRAGTAKLAFLGQWNPVATGLGLPARSRLGI